MVAAAAHVEVLVRWFFLPCPDFPVLTAVPAPRYLGGLPALNGQGRRPRRLSGQPLVTAPALGAKTSSRLYPRARVSVKPAACIADGDREHQHRYSSIRPAACGLGEPRAAVQLTLTPSARLDVGDLAILSPAQPCCHPPVARLSSCRQRRTCGPWFSVAATPWPGRDWLPVATHHLVGVAPSRIASVPATRLLHDPALSRRRA